MSVTEDVSSAFKAALSSVMDVYEEWGDIMATAEELEEVLEQGFEDYIMDPRFFDQLKAVFPAALDTLRSFDVDELADVLTGKMQEVADTVKDTVGVDLSKPITAAEDLASVIKDYLPDNLPGQDTITAFVELVGKYLSVDLKENQAAATQETAGSAGQGDVPESPSANETTETPSEQTASGESANALLGELEELLLPGFREYQANLEGVFDRMQDIVEDSGIAELLEERIQAIKDNLFPGHPGLSVAESVSFSIRELMDEIPDILRELMIHALAVLEKLVELMFEAIAMLREIIKTIQQKLQDFPELGIGDFVAKLMSRETPPGLVSLPALAIAIPLVPVYKAMTGSEERPVLSPSFFQECVPTEAFVWHTVSLIIPIDFLIVGLALFKPDESYEAGKKLVSASGKLFEFIFKVILNEKTKGESNDPESNDKDLKASLEPVNSIITIFSILFSILEWWKNRSIGKEYEKHKKTGAIGGEENEKDEKIYKDSLSGNSRFSFYLNEVIGGILGLISLGVNAAIVAIEEQEKEKEPYDKRQQAAALIGSIIGLLNTAFKWFNNLEENRSNREERKLILNEYEPQKYMAAVEDKDSVENDKYFWIVNGKWIDKDKKDEKDRHNTNLYEANNPEDKVSVIAKYSNEKAPGSKRILVSQEKAVNIKGVPKVGKTLKAEYSGIYDIKEGTTPQYQWKVRWEDENGIEKIKNIFGAITKKYTVKIGPKLGEGEVLHKHQLLVEMTYNRKSDNAETTLLSRPLRVLNTEGEVKITSATGNLQAKVNDELTATLTDADGVDESKSIQFIWYVKRPNVSISELQTTGSEYKNSFNKYTIKIGPGADEVLHRSIIVVAVTYTDKGGTEKTVYSLLIRVVP